MKTELAKYLNGETAKLKAGQRTGNFGHTPGPWIAERMINPPKAKNRRCGFVINGPENGEPLPERICDLRVPSGLTGFNEGKANAQLIAAGPELLYACEMALDKLISKDVICTCENLPAPCAICALRTAIAKATGK